MLPKFILNYFLLFLITTILSSCDTFIGVSEGPPLPGKRISILAKEKKLSAEIGSDLRQILLPPPTPNNSWPQSGGYANHAMHHIKVDSSLEELWSTDIGSGTDDSELLFAPPILAGKTIYTMDAENQIIATNADTGNELWSKELENDEDEHHISGGLAYSEGNLYITTGWGEVICLDSNSGKEKWKKNFGLPMRTPPTIWRGRIFVITVTNKLLVLNSSDGEELWSHQSIDETTTILGGASPAVDNGVVVVAYSSGELAALKVENGQQLWSDVLSSSGGAGSSTKLSAIKARPVIDRGLVFAMSNQNLLVSIDIRTGRRVWTKPFGGIGNPWVAGNLVYVISSSYELVALSRKTGNIYWVKTLNDFYKTKKQHKNLIWTGPILVSDRLLVANTKGHILSISPYSGEILGNIKLSDGLTVPPIAALNTVYFLTEDADLIAYR